MADSITYKVANMRVTQPTAKVAEANPDRAFTVNGTEWFQIGTDGKPNKLSIKSKNVTVEAVRSPVFAIDIAKGTLTLPEGRRGRTASAGLDSDALTALLDNLRSETS